MQKVCLRKAEGEASLEVLPLENILQLQPIGFQDFENVSVAAAKILSRPRYATMFSQALINVFEWDV